MKPEKRKEKVQPLQRYVGRHLKLEKIKEKPLPLSQYIGRQLKYALISILLIIVSLLIGLFGYHYVAELSWIDSLLNACMILTGMGPIDEMKTDAAKWFASFYSLYSGVAFLGTSAVLIAPLVHRILHLFHAEE